MIKTPESTLKKGFTIIEVALVLAIGGLIFMMVFTALPALQRSQRDSQRGTDMGLVSTQLNNYMANNRGRIPTGEGGVVGHEAVYDKTEAAKHNVKIGNWAYFYNSYLINNSNGQVDSFMDPDGSPYSLYVVSCMDQKVTKNNEPCANGQRNSVSFDEQASGTIGGVELKDGSDTLSHVVSIITNAACDGEVAMSSTSARKVAIVYKKEGGGIICRSN